jgi:16S rRNA (guanine966-N2)-methyltransferase
MRVVGGRLRGRALAGPRTDAIRPTSDRLRERLFNVLAHAYGDPVSGARVLDLFAGTGALAIEALSRGARDAVLVDDSAQARGIIRTNIDTLGLAGVAKLLKRDATKLGLAGPLGPFDLVFCDPPYGKGLAQAALASLVAGHWLTPDSLVIVEERAGEAITTSLRVIEHRDQGDTRLWFLRPAPVSPAS